MPRVTGHPSAAAARGRQYSTTFSQLQRTFDFPETQKPNNGGSEENHFDDHDDDQQDDDNESQEFLGVRGGGDHSDGDDEGVDEAPQAVIPVQRQAAVRPKPAPKAPAPKVVRVESEDDDDVFDSEGSSDSSGDDEDAGFVRKKKGLRAPAKKAPAKAKAKPAPKAAAAKAIGPISNARHAPPPKQRLSVKLGLRGATARAASFTFQGGDSEDVIEVDDDEDEDGDFRQQGGKLHGSSSDDDDSDDGEPRKRRVAAVKAKKGPKTKFSDMGTKAAANAKLANKLPIKQAVGGSSSAGSRPLSEFDDGYESPAPIRPLAAPAVVRPPRAQLFRLPHNRTAFVTLQGAVVKLSKLCSLPGTEMAFHRANGPPPGGLHLQAQLNKLALCQRPTSSSSQPASSSSSVTAFLSGHAHGHQQFSSLASTSVTVTASTTSPAEMVARYSRENVLILTSETLRQLLDGAQALPPGDIGCSASGSAAIWNGSSSVSQFSQPGGFSAAKAVPRAPLFPAVLTSAPTEWNFPYALELIDDTDVTSQPAGANTAGGRQDHTAAQGRKWQSASSKLAAAADVSMRLSDSEAEDEAEDMERRREASMARRLQRGASSSLSSYGSGGLSQSQGSYSTSMHRQAAAPSAASRAAAAGSGGGTYGNIASAASTEPLQRYRYLLHSVHPLTRTLLYWRHGGPDMRLKTTLAMTSADHGSRGTGASGIRTGTGTDAFALLAQKSAEYEKEKEDKRRSAAQKLQDRQEAKKSAKLSAAAAPPSSAAAAAGGGGTSRKRAREKHNDGRLDISIADGPSPAKRKTPAAKSAPLVDASATSLSAAAAGASKHRGRPPSVPVPPVVVQRTVASGSWIAKSSNTTSSRPQGQGTLAAAGNNNTFNSSSSSYSLSASARAAHRPPPQQEHEFTEQEEDGDDFF